MQRRALKEDSLLSPFESGNEDGSNANYLWEIESGTEPFIHYYVISKHKKKLSVKQTYISASKLFDSKPNFIFNGFFISYVLKIIRCRFKSNFRNKKKVSPYILISYCLSHLIRQIISRLQLPKDENRPNWCGTETKS